MKEAERRLSVMAWVLSAVVVALSVIVWGQSLEWQFSGISNYQIFPVLGLIAFSLMWSHYIVSVTRQHFKIDKSSVRTYFEITSFLVLIALALHPGLLTWQLWRDGQGLPPFSYERLYGWATLLGTVSWLVFIAYEFRRKFDKRPWWRFVGYASDVAMLAILYHGLKLGTQLKVDWFRFVWYVYGLTLIGALAYIYYRKLAIINDTSKREAVS